MNLDDFNAAFADYAARHMPERPGRMRGDGLFHDFSPEVVQTRPAQVCIMPFHFFRQACWPLPASTCRVGRLADHFTHGAELFLTPFGTWIIPN